MLTNEYNDDEKEEEEEEKENDTIKKNQYSKYIITGIVIFIVVLITMLIIYFINKKEPDKSKPTPKPEESEEEEEEEPEFNTDISCKKYGLTIDETNNGCVMEADLDTANAECGKKLKKTLGIKDKQFVVCNQLSDTTNDFRSVEGCKNNNLQPYTLGRNYKFTTGSGVKQFKTCFKKCPHEFKSKFPEDFTNYNGLPECIIKDDIDVNELEEMCRKAGLTANDEKNGCEMLLNITPEKNNCPANSQPKIMDINNRKQIVCAYTSNNQWVEVSSCKGEKDSSIESYIPYRGVRVKACFFPCPRDYTAKFDQNLQQPSHYPSCINNNNKYKYY